MKVIILAAGEGSRLRPYTLERPKCLVEIQGKSLLDRQLEILEKEGVTETVVIGGYLSGMLEGRGMRFYTNPRYDETNMIWTLFCAEEELRGELIIAYGDIVYSGEALRSLLASEADIAVTVDMEWESYWRARFEDPLDDAESLKMTKDGQLLEIGQQPDSVEDIQGQYMGLMKFSASGTETMVEIFHDAKKRGTLRGKPVENAYMTDLLQAIIEAGHRIDAVPVHGGWIEVDTVEDLESRLTIERLEIIDRDK